MKKVIWQIMKNPVYEVKDGSITFNNVGFSYNKNKDNLVLEISI